MLKKAETTRRLYNIGGMAVVRTDSFERACEIADGCIEGGIPSMEMSFTEPTAGDLIKQLKAKYGDELMVGAGTVLDGETARIAILDGADFIISCSSSQDAATVCNRYQIPYGPGCTSYTEAVNGLSWGAAFIKAYPISNFYGPDLAKVFKTPLPDMPILASGGINLDNLETWLKNGADICAMGGLLTKGSSAEIAANAKKAAAIIKEYR